MSQATTRFVAFGNRLRLGKPDPLAKPLGAFPILLYRQSFHTSRRSAERQLAEIYNADYRFGHEQAIVNSLFDCLNYC